MEQETRRLQAAEITVEELENYMAGVEADLISPNLEWQPLPSGWCGWESNPQILENDDHFVEQIWWLRAQSGIAVWKPRTSLLHLCKAALHLCKNLFWTSPPQPQLIFSPPPSHYGAVWQAWLLSVAHGPGTLARWWVLQRLWLSLLSGPPLS